MLTDSAEIFPPLSSLKGGEKKNVSFYLQMQDMQKNIGENKLQHL